MEHKVAVYAGVPCSLNATTIAWKVLEDIEQKNQNPQNGE